jgi:hypothetical protein
LIRVRKKLREDVPDELLALTNGCPATATLYNEFTIEGQLFKTKEVDAFHHMDNSIILCEFLMHNAFGDANVKDFIGYIKEILELDFLHIQKFLINCTWFGADQIHLLRWMGMVFFCLILLKVFLAQ